MQGVLLVNLGTPDAPEEKEVRAYLAEFLGDPRVLTMPSMIRWLLLNCIILRTRPAKSAAAYRSIWTERGSPLKFHSEDLAEAVQKALGDDYLVALGFRYGSPSMDSALIELLDAGVESVTMLPLYPQYAESTTGSTIAEFERLKALHEVTVPTSVIQDFFDDAKFLDASTAVIVEDEEKGSAEHLLFSFHGLPESHLKAADPTGARCLKREDCCDTITEENASCYRAQCYATAKGIVARLDRAPESWSVAFQSRLGRTPWIQPYAVDVIDQLAEQGVESMRVVCPSFVADCLETLEEIAEEAAEQFVESGGKAFFTVPCLNSRKDWAETVAQLVRNAAPRA